MTTFNWHQEAHSQWNQKVSFWNQKSENMWENGSRKGVIPLVQQHVKKDGTVIDIGCGDGYGTRLLAQAGYKALGVDLSTEMVEKAKELHEHVATFKAADVMDLPFDDDLADAVVVINVLEWTEQPLVALNEIKRVVKSGGHACVGILGPTAQPRTNSYRRLYGENVICNTMMPWEFQQLAFENGWEIIDGEGVYKKGVNQETLVPLSSELKQSLSFLWLFILKKM
ncbi:methyltransferase domain-containing protein [Priestia flexa]|uniref:class I SAM-dependent methyltransferase n=1 Tax=Priestia flexa TaxID=86664 RepID=UPI002E1C8217|nr:methyltransferase domain-containing protein [Priestia flexa]MED3823215.1 methyltransferase domain-containing protein [Priestia flexa]